jgi:hypothetical protein
MRKCSKCGIERPLTEFHKDKSKKDGRKPSCKTCRNHQNAKWYVQNKEKVKQYSAEYCANPENKERRKQYGAEYYANPENKEKISKNRAERYVRNKGKQPACIYEIKNVLSNKTYIGETTRGELRWKEHLCDLRGNRHQNRDLQQDFNKHGEEAFEWSIIKEHPKDKNILLLEEARELERRMDKGDDLYNLMLTLEQIKMLKENA